MLQTRINDLNSGIVNITGNKVRLTGFHNSNRLQAYETKKLDNWSSKGLYDVEEIVFNNLKSEALIVVQNNGREFARYQFEIILRDTVEGTNDKMKKTISAFEIRKSRYTSHYNFRMKDTRLLFNTLHEITEYMMQTFNYQLNIE
ncbi:hypothetical protein CSV80_12460 [Sporosarcina sp. P12(2017)]|uniref:hypothetical protein n=1 Tax=unclassified Sporosarcina TaxID=2647733 RepID=UPI000C164BBC|nr:MULTISPECIES: hypothetical protein [unclassified Sporosarcina]PIC56569.1 hypothetical protein CSV81_14070 [Sporosarcina sp. P10]PIC60220.1 hypothetical protein CSV80_12460 [Sporosarcina sp. P12(2017)]